MLFGLAVGLSVAAAVWINDRRAPPAAGAAPAEKATAETARRPAAKPAAEAPPPSRFDFYEMLPNQRFVVAPELSDARAGAPPEIVPPEPGTYLLQAGSFSSEDDAEAMKGNLALLGIQAYIQPYTEGARTYHRVRIGPLTDLQRFDEYRRRLRKEQIDFMVLRAAD